MTMLAVLAAAAGVVLMTGQEPGGLALVGAAVLGGVEAINRTR